MIYKQDEHKLEVKEKWGETQAYKEYKNKTLNYSNDKWNSLNVLMNVIFKDFSICMNNGESPTSLIVQELVKKLQNHISENYYYCTNEILFGLGQMYVQDERFKKNIDQYSEGTALFICDAIKIYCDR